LGSAQQEAKNQYGRRVDRGMSRFEKWLEGRKELAQTYKSIVGGVPQDPTHHPEGDVLTHVRMVRKQIPTAIQELQQLQAGTNSPLSHVFSDINFRISPQEEQIVSLAAWLHDIGKPTATTVGGEPWDQPGVQGKIQSIGHQSPQHYEPQLEKLKQVAPPETLALYTQHRDLINWLIEHHMDLYQGRFSKKFVAEHFDNGKLINSPQIKLLLILMWADKMGRNPESTIQGIAQSSQASVDQTQRAAKQQPFEGSPTEFAGLLKQRGVAPQFRMRSMKNKFPHLSDQEAAQLTAEGFSQFMENAGPTIISEQIPMKPEELKDCFLLKRILATPHLYMVGGAVRDYLFDKFHGQGGAGYSPKDIDLTTDISEEEILQRLRSPEAISAGVKVNEKQSVDTFGVVFAHVNGRDYEIAPFRKDVGVADGRRPERVERAGIEEDAMRRDLTMNNLYYDFEQEQILDFNPGGQGVQDIQNQTTRFVGNPFERIEEDLLRVLRMVRFFSRYNDGDMQQFLDQHTLQAIEQYKDLQGITPERIQDEFLKGLKSSVNTASYLKNYVNLGLFERVFQGLQVDEAGIDRLGNTKNPKVVLAWMLRGNQNLPAHLHSLTYPNETSDMVGFLISALNSDPEQIHRLILQRQRHLAKAGGPQQISQDLIEFATVAGRPDLVQRFSHLAGQGDWRKETDEEGKEQWAGQWNTPPYEPEKIDPSQLPELQDVEQGPAWGQAIDARTKTAYDQAYQDYLRQKGGSSPT
jgi:tRNA nucleotidyltransferase/poly(A) polymerase